MPLFKRYTAGPVTTLTVFLVAIEVISDLPYENALECID
jgi:hypothetical protein